MKSFLFALLTSILIFVSFQANAADKQTAGNDRSPAIYAPRLMSGILKYTGGVFAPIHFWEPYKYALYNIDGRFLAYVDDAKIVKGQLDNMINAHVIIRGSTSTVGKDILILAEHITFKTK